MKNIYCIFIISFVTLTGFSQTHEVPYTLADRDRLIRTEEKVESLGKEIISLRHEMDAKFEGVYDELDSQQQQISDLKTLFLWGFGILFSLLLFMFGYIIWDRRTALNPVREKISAEYYK